MAALVLPAMLAGVGLGLLAADGGLIRGGGAAAAAGAGAVLLALSRLAWPRPGRIAAGFAVLLLGMGLGAWRGAGAVLPSGPGSVAALVGEADSRLAGTVAEEPRPRGERLQAVLDGVAVEVTPGAWRPVDGRILAWLPRSAAVRAGDRIAVEAHLQAPRDFDGFAYRAYLARQGIGAIASSYGATIIGHRQGAIPEALGAARRTLLEALYQLIPEPEASLGGGILLGARSSIAPEVSDAFAQAGLTHVVAISGWNIAIVAALAAAATRPMLRLRGGRFVAILTAALAVGAYVLLTGASPSVVRAALMAAALVFARLGGSRAHASSALMLAALAMLLAAPTVLWDVGFQLSALATAGLIWFGLPIERHLAGWPALVREPVALTLAAQLTTLPVILLSFERLSLVAPLANVLVVPLVPLVMLTSALAASIGALAGAVHVPLVSETAAWAVGGSAWLYLRLMILAGQAAAAVPFASVEIGAPGWLGFAWYPALVILARRAGPAGESAAAHQVAGAIAGAGWVRPLPLALVTLAVVGMLTLATRPDGRLHLVVLDVGQGDAILIRAPSGATMLVDGGPDPELVARRLGEELPFWQRTIDVVVLTHPHEDHVAGLITALERFRVGEVVEPGRASDNPSHARFAKLAASEPGATQALARAGLRLSLDAITHVTFLFPSEADAAAPLPDGDINNGSAVLLLESGQFRALLTGDAEAPVERLLLARGLLGPVDVLKVAHHGSDSGTTAAFLEAVRPSIAVISCGIDNEYGHPHSANLERLAAIPGLRVRRTDIDGTVRLVIDPQGVGRADRPSAPAGSIGPWPSHPVTALTSSWTRIRCRRGSSRTRGEWRASPPRPLGSRRPEGSPSMPASSRSPPCCMTSTSPRRGAAAASMGWLAPAG